MKKMKLRKVVSKNVILEQLKYNGFQYFKDINKCKY